MRARNTILVLSLTLSSSVFAQNTSKPTASCPAKGSPSSGKEVVVRVPNDKPNAVQLLKQGDTLVFQLSVQPGTGYTWVVRGDPGGMRKLGNTTYIQSAKEPGAVETQIVKLVADRVGEYDISLAYVPIWDEASPSQVVTTHVKVDRGSATRP
jgi:predicted secreted protein